MAKTMLEGIPKREYPRLFYRYFKEFLEVLAGKTSLKLYLAHNYPSLYKPKFKEGEKLKWKGSKFEVPKFPKTCEYIGGVLILGGMYSIPECHVEAGDIVFDVGAYFGFFSYHAVQKGGKEVYAFEPNPYVFEILKKNAEMWSDKIKPYQLALSDRNGEADLFISKELGVDSTILENRENSLLKFKKYNKKVKVKTMTLDSFVKEYNVERVDFIRIDAEGSERDIIKGAKETIKKFKPRMAIAAYHLLDDKKVIPKLVLSIRDDYKFKLVNKGEENLFFF
jgi:FkbM family methyltransferase